MGGGESKISEAASTPIGASPGPVGHWNPAREEWWTSVSSSYENITTVGDALTSCWTLLESSWSIRSEGLQTPTCIELLQDFLEPEYNEGTSG